MSVVYKPSYVTFLDILGFKQFVTEHSADEVAKVLDIVQENALYEDDIKKIIDLESLVVSDAVIRGKGLEKNFGEAILQTELVSLVLIQIRLVYNGIFIRGGVAIGYAYISPGRFFGPAYQEAYELESKTADYPRIVLADDVVDTFDENETILGGSGHGQAREELRQLITKREDGVWFLDYLRASESECDDEYQFLAFIARHRDLIKANLSKFAACPSVLRKYEWLKSYHNDFVAGLNSDVLEQYDTKKSALEVSDQGDK